MTFDTLRRRHPPAYSPLSLPALSGATRAALGGPDPRVTLAAHLRLDYAADHVLLTDSGTDALQFAIAVALGVAGPATAVALPAYSCYDVASAAVGADATITCYDLDPRTLGPDLASLERCLRAGARTVVVATLCGVPPDWGSIAACCEAWHAVIIEDAAQGHGARWRGRPLGGLAPIGILSFGRGKGWTGARGGAVLFRSPGPWNEDLTTLGPRSFSSELLGLAGAAGQWLLGRPGLFGYAALVPGLHLGETRYHPPRAPRPMRRSAAMLLEGTRPAAAAEAERRRTAAAEYVRELSGVAGVDLPVPAAGGVPGWLRFPVSVARGWSGLPDHRAASAFGIAPGYPRPIAALPAVAERLLPIDRGRRWPGAEALVAGQVTLPTHSLLTAEDRAAVVRIVRGYAASAEGSTRR